MVAFRFPNFNFKISSSLGSTNVHKLFNHTQTDKNGLKLFLKCYQFITQLGFRRQDGFVYFFHNGNPIYCTRIQNPVRFETCQSLPHEGVLLLIKIMQYSTNEIDSNIKVVNREYSNIQCKIKKEREKFSRLKANSYNFSKYKSDYAVQYGDNMNCDRSGVLRLWILCPQKEV